MNSGIKKAPGAMFHHVLVSEVFICKETVPDAERHVNMYPAIHASDLSKQILVFHQPYQFLELVEWKMCVNSLWTNSVNLRPSHLSSFSTFSVNSKIHSHYPMIEPQYLFVVWHGFFFANTFATSSSTAVCPWASSSRRLSSLDPTPVLV